MKEKINLQDVGKLTPQTSSRSPYKFQCGLYGNPCSRLPNGAMPNDNKLCKHYNKLSCPIQPPSYI